MDPSLCPGYPAEIVLSAQDDFKYLSVLRNALRKIFQSKGRRLWVPRLGEWSTGSTYLSRSECGARGRKLFRITQLVVGKTVVSVRCDQESCY